MLKVVIRFQKQLIVKKTKYYKNSQQMRIWKYLNLKSKITMKLKKQTLRSFIKQ